MSHKIFSKLVPKTTLGKVLLAVAIFLIIATLPILLSSDGPLRKHKEIPAQTEVPPAARQDQTSQSIPDSFTPTPEEGPFSTSKTDLGRADWSWNKAKKLSSAIWSDNSTSRRMTSFYCGCDIEGRGASGGVVDLKSCGVTPRKSPTRANRLEWEHVMPASIIARGRSCWTQGADICVGKDGKPFKGRSCCEIADPIYNMAATDPVNLVPSVGEINGDRSNFPYGIIPGEPRAYGACDMEIDFQNKLAEPPASKRGDVARIWAYMSQAYGITISQDEANQYLTWMTEDPISSEEIYINERIKALGHRSNPFVLIPDSETHTQ